jgi:hypothetical protein
MVFACSQLPSRPWPWLRHSRICSSCRTRFVSSGKRISRSNRFIEAGLLYSASSSLEHAPVRGPRIAVGRSGRVHVAWNGSPSTAPGAIPMVCTRLNDAGTAFEPQRNLMCEFPRLRLMKARFAACGRPARFQPPEDASRSRSSKDSPRGVHDDRRARRCVDGRRARRSLPIRCRHVPAWHRIPREA